MNIIILILLLQSTLLSHPDFRYLCATGTFESQNETAVATSQQRYNLLFVVEIIICVKRWYSSARPLHIRSRDIPSSLLFPVCLVFHHKKIEILNAIEVIEHEKYPRGTPRLERPDRTPGPVYAGRKGLEGPSRLAIHSVWGRFVLHTRHRGRGNTEKGDSRCQPQGIYLDCRYR